MLEVKMKNLEDLRFVLTDEMNEIFIKILIIKQRLEEEITTSEQMILKNELHYLTNKFISEFKKNNVKQIKYYNSIMQN